MDYKARQQRLRKRLDDLNLDALFITHLPNIRYLCGFTGSAGVLVVTRSQSVFFTDGRYTQQARTEVASAKTVVARRNTFAEAANWLLGSKVRMVGVEAEHLTVAAQRTLKEATKRRRGTLIRLRPTSLLVETLRMEKELAELDQIRAAVLLASSVFPDIVKHIRAGTPERTIAAEIEYFCRRAGADGMSFDTLVSSGQRSALPHGVASPEPIAKDGFVILDYGVILGGYCSDMTRTVYVGHIDDRSRFIYHAVLEAQQAAVAVVRDGVAAGEVDAAARNVLARSRLAKYFTHSTGHGLGLEIHELPRVAKDQPERLRSGMVVTIEPGVYIPDQGGVRIEDTVVVTAAGCEVLTPTSKELITI
jgi:Xaa-Pro aminopeptidase